MWFAIAGLLIQAQAAQPVPKHDADHHASERCVAIVRSPDDRVAPDLKIAPGQPPVLSFRYFEGQLHHRYSNSDLMLDDAGH